MAPLYFETLEPRRLLSASVLTYHYDNSRTGLNNTETTLTPANVQRSTFGKLFVDPVDGKVDAQPLYVPGINVPGKGVHNVLFVASENDTLYAFDADSNTGPNAAPLWQTSLLIAGEEPSDNRGCTQITPTIGITATPVIDPVSQTIYVTAMSKRVANGESTYFQRLWAIDITTGQSRITPVEVQASVPSTGPNSSHGALTFIPANYAERAALTLVNGTIFTTWTSHCDQGTYNGWIIAYDAATLRQSAVLCTTPNGSGGAFWGSGAGPAVDAAGNLYTLEGNGTFDAALDAGGFPSRANFGGTFIKVSTTNRLAVADYFAPSNIISENDQDKDLGSGGAVVLPDMSDSTGHVHHLAIGAGKDGNIYLIDRDNLGKRASRRQPSIYQQVLGAVQGGEYATSAYFNGSVYYGPRGGRLLQFRFHNARLDSKPASRSRRSFGYPGATPSISANGVANAIVWAAEAASNGQAVLHAYDAANLGHELYNSQMAGPRDGFGLQNKFITPVVANGKVYVATRNGVGVFGLLA